MQTRLFKRALYLLVLLKIALWLGRYDLYFGPDSIVYTSPVSIHDLDSLAFLLYSLSSAKAACFFLFPLMALCILGWFRPRISFPGDLLIWFLVLNLHNRLYATLTGGDYLLNQLLFFNCFLSNVYSRPSTRLEKLKLLLHNFAVVAVMLQVCFVYLLSALAKLQDADWLSGNAVWLVAQTDHFSIRSNPESNPYFKGLYRVANYGVLFYQLLFPAIIWIRRFKKLLVLPGVLMHLYIAFVMGLPVFGLTMILGYIYFWPFKNQAK